MADTKISAMTSASTMDGTEAFPIVQSSTTKKGLLSQVLTYILGSTGLATLIKSTIASQIVAGTNVTKSVGADSVVTLAASGGGGSTSTDIDHIGYVSGTAYPSYSQGASGTVSPVTDQMVAIPILTEADVVAASLIIRISTNVAGGLCKVARYTCVGGNPGTLIAEAVAPLDLGTNHQSLNATFATNPTLLAGQPSFAVFIFNSVSTGAQFFSQTAADSRARAFFGSDPGPFGIGSVNDFYTGVATYSSGFPNNFGTATPSSTIAPMVWFKVA